MTDLTHKKSWELETQLRIRVTKTDIIKSEKLPEYHLFELIDSQTMQPHESMYPLQFPNTLHNLQKKLFEKETYSG